MGEMFPKNVVQEPKDDYKRESEIIELLKQSLQDKDKIIASLERELAAYRSNSK